MNCHLSRQEKKQLSQNEVETSQQLSRIRIHVECVIGAMKNRYTILKGPIPTPMLKRSNDTDVANINKILAVCAPLTNLCPSILFKIYIVTCTCICFNKPVLLDTMNFIIALCNV